ncbi:Brix domain-containing protein, partial [Scenedesmus sp. NREL 46B-D3]
PQTFVFRRGKHWGMLGDLESDLRRMMLPNTASSLRESKRNSLKDFVSVAGPLGVSHFLMLTATEKATYLRVAKAPRGPTLTLRIRGHSLASDVAASQARPRMPPNAFKTAPLVVLNNFAPQQKQLALAASLFQGMFPSINVHSVNLATCQRVVLLSVDADTGLISLRHFTISTAPSGVKKSLKALMARQALPDLGRLQDVSELLTKSGYGSESEGEDPETSRVVLEGAAAGRAGRALAGRQSRVRLHEVGPRLEMEIVKVEEGLCGGAVLYHAHVSRTKKQASAQQAAKDEAAQLRAARRRQQEDNVRRKEVRRRQALGGCAAVGAAAR